MDNYLKVAQTIPAPLIQLNKNNFDNTPIFKLQNFNRNIERQTD